MITPLGVMLLAFYLALAIVDSVSSERHANAYNIIKVKLISHSVLPHYLLAHRPHSHRQTLYRLSHPSHHQARGLSPFLFLKRALIANSS